jgi:PAS domain S-box-containing protein
MAEPTDQLLLVGGTGEDLEALRRALALAGRSLRVSAVPDFQEARVVLLHAPTLAVLVDVRRTPHEPADWTELIAETGRHAALLALATAEDEALVVRWLEQGASDWVFRPSFLGLIGVLARLEREARERVDHEATQRRLRESTGALVQLARSPRFRGDDLAAALHEITETGALRLPATRCGVWLFNDARTKLRLVDGFDTRTHLHAEGQDISVSEHRNYFDALASQRLLSVAEARADARTQDFVTEYLGPHGIHSLLDVSVRLRGEVVGALCLEQCDGSRHWSVEEEVFAGALADVVSLALEGAERFRVESALLQSERRFRDLFRYSNDAILLYRVALDGTVFCEDMNLTGERLTGLPRDAVIGKTFAKVLPPNSAERLRERYEECIRTRTTVMVEHELEVPNGRRIFNTNIVPLLDESGRVQRLATVARDVTQQREAESLQRRLESEVAESQKSEALGRLASHIAHDVNNLLTVIVAHASRLQGLPGKPAEVSQAILQATSRGRDLTQQVLTFGRRRPPERKPMDWAPLVRETLKLLEPTAPGIAMREIIAAHGTRVLGDTGQLHQVLTNLCTNALHAMPGRGTMTVKLESVEVDYALAARHPPLQAGTWVRLTVEDTGVGMEEATRRRIFEPFFSTRPDGKGTGLGLAVVHSIVTGHDGAVVVDSQPGRGSSFAVYLPALEEEAERPGQGQHLMLVDDHPGMARVSAKLLETLGYRTSVFDDPREALAAFRVTPTGFDAVITDLSMPQMSGEDFTRALHAIRATLPVIVSSGLAGQLDLEELREVGVSAVLVKPWRLEEAVATLKRVLAH